MLNRCTPHTPILTPSHFPAVPTLTSPGLPSAPPCQGFGQDQVCLQRPAGGRGPIVVAPEAPAGSWTEQLLKYVALIPLTGPLVRAAAKVLPSVIEDMWEIWAGLTSAFERPVHVGPPAAPVVTPAPAAPARDREAEQRAEIAERFHRVHGWAINEGAYGFYMGMLKEGRTTDEVETKMREFKETRAQYGLSY